MVSEYHRFFFEKMCNNLKIDKTKLFFLQSVDDVQHQLNITVVQIVQTVQSFLDHFGIFLIFIEKAHGRDLKIITDCHKFCHGGQGLAGRNVIDVSTAMPQVVAHFVFGDSLLHTQL